jgi:hypothetical protein
VEGLPDEAAKGQLTKILGLDSWWNHFFFSARNFGVERQWSAFRRRRLHDELEQTLKKVGIPLPFPSKSETLSTPLPASSPAAGAGPESALRRLAAAVIRRLPDSDLREVWLPLGYVLDEIGEK